MGCTALPLVLLIRVAVFTWSVGWGSALLGQLNLLLKQHLIFKETRSCHLSGSRFQVLRAKAVAGRPLETQSGNSTVLLLLHCSGQSQPASRHAGIDSHGEGRSSCHIAKGVYKDIRGDSVLILQCTATTYIPISWNLHCLCAEWLYFSIFDVWGMHGILGFGLLFVVFMDIQPLSLRLVSCSFQV